MKFYYFINKMVLKSIKDYPIHNKEDKEKYFSILSNNFRIGQELVDNFKSKIDFDFTPLGEIYTKVPENIDESIKQYLEKYFFVVNNKVGSRGIGYYGLFGDAYKVENRKTYYKSENLEKTWKTFWKEYDEYIIGLEKLKKNDQLILLYLDNYRNFILLWLYIWITIRMSQNKNSPIHFFHLKKVDNTIKSFIDELISIYGKVIDIIINKLANSDSEFINLQIQNLPSIKNFYFTFKAIFEEKKIIDTKKKQGISLKERFYSGNGTKLWFEKLFRNNREEDNLGIILSFFLNKKNNKKFLFNSLSDIKKIIDNTRNSSLNSKKMIFSLMYGGIEFALVAKYLGYKAALINYSVYHLKNKNSLINWNDNDIVYFLGDKDVLQTENYIVDDNVLTGNTLNKIKTIFEANHIPITTLAVPRIYLDKKERKILKELSKSKDIGKVIAKYSPIKLSEIKKVLALNVLYQLPRIKKKSRNINLLIARKVMALKRKYSKHFRSL